MLEEIDQDEEGLSEDGQVLVSNTEDDLELESTEELPEDQVETDSEE